MPELRGPARDTHPQDAQPGDQLHWNHQWVHIVDTKPDRHDPNHPATILVVTAGPGDERELRYDNDETIRTATRRPTPKPNQPTGWRGTQACTIAGITYRQLDYWARTDLLKPSITDARGSGTHRRYSYRDLLELKIIKRLLDAGISLQAARRAIHHLHHNLADGDPGNASLVLHDAEVVVANTGDEIHDLIRNGHGVLNILPLAAVKHELDNAIADLATAS